MRHLLVNADLAAKIGLHEAIILQQVYYWTAKHQHLQDGYYWVYNSYPEWQKQFPFWDVSTVKRLIRKLERQNLLIAGNYNKMGIDRTKWYRVNYQLINSIINGVSLPPSIGAICPHQ